MWSPPALLRRAALAVIVLALATAVPPAAGAQSALRVTPDRVDLPSERGRAVVTIEGRDLATFREARVVDGRGRVARGFKVALGVVRGSVRPLEIHTSGAAPGGYRLELVSEKARAPLAIRLTVAAEGAAVESVNGPAEVEEGVPFRMTVRARFPSGAGKIVVTDGGRGGPSVEAKGLRAEAVVEIPALPAGSHTLLVQAHDAAGGAVGEATHGLVVLPAPAVSSLSLSETRAASGQQLTATVTLTRAAGSSLSVSLATDAPYVTVPPTATVPAGSTKVTFPVQVGEVPRDLRTAVVAVLGQEKAAAELTLVGPPVLMDFVVYGGNVSGGGQVMVSEPGEVVVRPRLDRPAPQRGTEVALSTTVPELVELPATITVPAGATELAVEVSHGVSPSPVTGRISARVGTAQLDYSIRFEPPALPLPRSLTIRGPGIPESSSVSAVGGVPLTAVVELIAPAPAGGVPVLFSGASLTPQGGGTQVVPAGVQRLEIPLETPRVEAPRVVNASVRMEGSFHTVEAQVELLPVPSELASLTFDEDWVTPFMDRTATVSFVEAAPVEREVVLTARRSDGSWWQGARITVPPGQTQASLVVQGLGNGEAAGTIDVTASFGGSSAQGTLETYPAVQVQALLLDPDVVYAGDDVTVEVVLESPAPPGGAELVVRGLHSAILMPEPRAAGNSTIVTVPPGATSATFVMEARTAESDVSLSVANPLGGTMSRTLNINEARTLQPISGGGQVAGGDGTRVLQLRLSDAPDTPTEVQLTTDRPDLIDLPPTVTFVTQSMVTVAYQVLHDPPPGEAIPFTVSATLRGQTVSQQNELVHSTPYVTTLEILPMWDRSTFYPGDEVRLRWALDRYPSQSVTVELLPERDGVLLNLPPAVVASAATGTVNSEIGAFDQTGRFEVRARTGDAEVATTIPLVLPDLVELYWRVDEATGPATEARLPLYGMPGQCVAVFDMPLPVRGELVTAGLELASDRPDLVQVVGPAPLRFPHQAGSNGRWEVPMTCNVAVANEAGLSGPTPFQVTATWRGQTRSTTVTLRPEGG